MLIKLYVPSTSSRRAVVNTTTKPTIHGALLYLCCLKLALRSPPCAENELKWHHLYQIYGKTNNTFNYETALKGWYSSEAVDIQVKGKPGASGLAGCLSRDVDKMIKEAVLEHWPQAEDLRMTTDSGEYLMQLQITKISRAQRRAERLGREELCGHIQA